jgi:hypothetical protein
MRRPWPLLLLVLLPIGACSPPRKVELLDTPGSGARGEPSLTAGADGKLYLSWVEDHGGDHVLAFSRWEDMPPPGRWSPAKEIARGNDWFVNWADFPGMGVLPDGTLFAHWLARVPGGPESYGIHVTISRDGGVTWSPPVVPHRDTSPGEHGFVSWVVSDPGHMGVTWLDGRDVKEDTLGHVTGSTQLRFTTVDREGRLGEEVLLDDRVCDCCATSSVRLAGGEILIAYRDRSPDEVRDISVVLRRDGVWSAPRPVHRDGWKIDGCPVNGPAVDASGRQAVVAWYTMPDADSGRVEVAFSEDGGERFDPPRRVDGGDPLGRVDVTMTGNGRALVVWLEQTAPGKAEIRAREVRPDAPPGRTVVIAETSPARGSGFPRVARHRGRTFFAWTVIGPTPEIRSAVMR